MLSWYPSDMPPAPSSNFSGAGHNTVTASTLSDFEKSNRGGTPESPGVRQYVFQPGCNWKATPPSSTAPLREPASSRIAEWPSLCHGEASCARASVTKRGGKQGGGKAECGAELEL